MPNLRHHHPVGHLPPVFPTKIYHWINSKLKRDGKNPQKVKKNWIFTPS
jgi:hypothetical protein